MELRQYLSPLLKWWWLIVASVVVAAGSSFLATRAMPKTYMSKATLMVGQALQNPNPSQSEFYTGQILAQSYADLARREPVLRSALEALGYDWNWTALRDMVNSQVIEGTQLFDIIVIGGDPEQTRMLVDEIARQLILQSPAATDPQKEEERQFIQTQIEELKNNIRKGQQEMRDLNTVIANATSARQIQDGRTRQAALQTQVASWQATYAQLLANMQVGTPNFLRVVEPAQTPVAPIGPRVNENVMLAAAIGLALSGVAAFLLEYIDDTVKTPDDVRQLMNLPVLGSITRLQGKDYASKLVTARHPRSPVAEAYRMVRTNLQFSAVNRSLQTLVITSSNPLEGKSVTAANLAVILAQAGKRVILVDADLRRPSLHRIFALSNSAGLTSALLDRDMPLSQVLQDVGVQNLSVLTAGPLPPDPSELLGSTRMKQVIAALKEHADVVVFDTPPVLVVTDAQVLASHVDGVMLVVNAGNTRRATAVRSKEAIAGVGAYIAGVVLNRTTGRSETYYHYYSYSEVPARRSLFTLPRLLQRSRSTGRKGRSSPVPDRGASTVDSPVDVPGRV